LKSEGENKNRRHYLLTDPRRMDLKEIGSNARNWIDSAQDRG